MIVAFDRGQDKLCDIPFMCTACTHTFAHVKDPISICHTGAGRPPTAVGVSRLGLVVKAGKLKDTGSIPRFGSPFSSKIFIYGHCSLVTLPCTINETVKWLTSLAHLNAEIILVVTV